MKLGDYVESLRPDNPEERRRKKLAEEKSYEILDYVEGFEDRFEEAKQGDSLFGSTSPSVFVGRSRYPNVPVGILSPVGGPEEVNPDDFATSGDWYERGLGIDGVLKRRTGLVNSRNRANARIGEFDMGFDSGFLGTQREVAIADSPVDVEVRLPKTRDVLDIGVDLDSVATPTGPNTDAVSADLAENPSVPREVEKTLEDDDWKTEGAVEYLYDKGLDVYEINRVLSVGALGKKENRRLVPTRWSITAVDDMVGKYLHREIRNKPSVDETTVHISEYMGNRYWVVLSPGQWEFELVEVKSPGSVWNPEDGDVWTASAHEGYAGRSTYVDETSGAYYAARLGVLEHLRDEGRQAKALVVREVTDGYWAPVGVWQIRESVRDAFDDDGATEEAFHDAVSGIADYLPVTEEHLRRKSTMYAGVQTGLGDF